MKKFLINFKSIIQFLVSIIASREFAFIYCVFGTIAQTAHTYYLLDGISSLNGAWKITQSILLSFFISSSLLYFTAISDSNDKSPSGKRVLNAVTLFMWLEIVINLYYYSKHIVIDTNNFDTNNLFQLAFGVLIACIIPITIKLYSSQIRAKEWLELDEKPKEISSEIQTEIFDNINLLAERNNQLDTNLNDLRSEFGLISSKLDDLKSEPIESEFGTNPKEYINNIVKESISENMGNINKEIEQSFSKQSDLFTRQFENKIKFMMDSKK